MPFKRHKQHRLPGYDYSGEGAYFITICTAGRQPCFGHIADGVMHYTPVGQYVADNLEGLGDKLPHLQVDEWEVMPDHIHLIISIHPQGSAGVIEVDVPYGDAESERAAPRRIPTPGKPSGPIRRNTSGLRPLTPKSIQSFANHFKGRITRWCDANGYRDFGWQSKFHDRIIRDYAEYLRITGYVRNNVAVWEDLYNSKVP